tara:strand:- start:232 stop:414 length:183 start_codon:yes stop_codon:yes gene_type:complete
LLNGTQCTCLKTTENNELLWGAAQSPLTESGTQSRFAGNPESMSGQGTANAMQESSEEKE